MRLGLIFCCAMLATAANAEVYRCDRGGGRVVYTDRPCSKGAKPAELPEINVIGTPGSKQSEADMARAWDERMAKQKAERARADARSSQEHDARQEKADRVRSGLNQRKVVKGMTEDQVRELLGEPDATNLQEGRENIMVWSYKPKDGPQYTISFRNGEVNSVSSRKGKKKK